MKCGGATLHLSHIGAFRDSFSSRSGVDKGWKMEEMVDDSSSYVPDQCWESAC